MPSDETGKSSENTTRLSLSRVKGPDLIYDDICMICIKQLLT